MEKSGRLALLSAYRRGLTECVGDLKVALLGALDAWQPGREPFSEALEELGDRLARLPFWREWIINPGRTVHPLGHDPLGQTHKHVSFTLDFLPPASIFEPSIQLIAVIEHTPPFLTYVQVLPADSNLPHSWLAFTYFTERPSPSPHEEAVRNRLDQPHNPPSDRHLAILALRLACRAHGLHIGKAGTRILRIVYE